MRAVIFLAALLSIPLVFGLGISHEYLPDKELALGAGENYVFKLIIQNEDLEPVDINVTLDSDIADLVGGGVITIPAETFDRAVYFDIKVPSDAEVGETYPLRYVVNPVEDGSGQVPFSVRYERVITVRVTEGGSGSAPVVIPTETLLEEEPAPQTNNWWVWPILIVLIAGLLVLVWRKSDVISQKFTKKQKPVAAKPLETDLETKPVVASPVEAKEVTGNQQAPEQPVENPSQETPSQEIAGVETPVETHPVASPTQQPEIQPQPNPVAIARARPEHAFILADGTRLFTILDVLQVAQENPVLCEEHVSAGNFALWIGEELQLAEVAQAVSKQTTTGGLVSVLNDALA